MGIIASDHSLPGQHGEGDIAPEAPGLEAGRSNYAYLFPDLANDPAAGVFPGTTPAETLERLKAFEREYRQHAFETRRMKLSPAYTYFGQFVNHDVSAPVGSVGSEAASFSPPVIINTPDVPGLSAPERAPDIASILRELRNEQERPLMLGSLYAEGPGSLDPEVKSLYEADGASFRIAQASLLDQEALGMTTKRPGRVLHRKGAADIPRDGARQKALIADRRNDENLLISQFHLALMLLHNKAVAALAPAHAGASARFAAARRLITWHYHWCIFNDYLPKLLSPGVLAKVISKPPRLRSAGQVPMEFTTAAFRFGHSMVGQEYDFNENFGTDGHVSPSAKLHELFAFTSRGRMSPFQDHTSQLPDHWVADWDRLTMPQAAHSGADRIDMRFAPDMLNHMIHAENISHGSIFFRNVVRGFHRRIAFGQEFARAYGVAPLTPAQILSAMPEEVRPAAVTAGLDRHTPAWLYCLCEADVLEAGERLGPVASFIIADTITGLMRRDEASLLREAPVWHPGDSILRNGQGQPLDSIRALLLYATEDQPRAS